MVAGLKQGDRVKAIAIKVLGAKKAENLFPATFKTQILHGVVLRKGTGRQMVVTWDDIDITQVHDISNLPHTHSDSDIESFFPLARAPGNDPNELVAFGASSCGRTPWFCASPHGIVPGCSRGPRCTRSTCCPTRPHSSDTPPPVGG